MVKLLVPAVAVAALALTQGGCPKKNPGTEPDPDATASPAAAESPTENGAPDDASARAETIHFRWSGGLSIYQYYDMLIESPEGSDTATVTFKVKPLRQEEAVVTDELSAEELSELRALFEEVNFEEIETAPRKVRIMDIGETAITRTRGGEEVSVKENPTMKAEGNLQPLRRWFDLRVREYLDEAGVSPKRSGIPKESPTAPPK